MNDLDKSALNKSAQLYDKSLNLNKQNYKSILSMAMDNSDSFINRAKKEANIKSVKNATFSQTKRFFKLVFTLPF